MADGISPDIQAFFLKAEDCADEKSPNGPYACKQANLCQQCSSKACFASVGCLCVHGMTHVHAQHGCRIADQGHQGHPRQREADIEGPGHGHPEPLLAASNW